MIVGMGPISWKCESESSADRQNQGGEPEDVFIYIQSCVRFHKFRHAGEYVRARQGHRAFSHQ